MTTFLIFSITRGKDISMDRVETPDDNPDPWESIQAYVSPPYQGESIVVKEDDVRRFKLRSHVVEV